MDEITNLIIEKNGLSFDYQNKKIKIKKSQVYPQIKVLLSEQYRQKLRDIEINHKLNLKSSIYFLIDLYYLETPEILELFLKLLLIRLNKGLNKSFVIRLKSIYIVLGQFLKKYRYIK